MPELHLRPRYRFVVPMESGTVLERVRKQMRRSNPADLKLRGSKEHLVLRFPSHMSHVWTPQMQIWLEPAGDGGTMIRAIVGPSSRIWQFFLGALTAMVTVGVVALLLGFVQWNNGGSPWGFYLAVVGLAGSLFLFFLFEAAKQRTKDEKDLLVSFLDNALNVDCVALSRATRGRATPVHQASQQGS